MIIDTHCHILPGVDDGAANFSVTEKMLHLAISEGIGAIIATPHYEYGMDKNALLKRNEMFQNVLQMAKKIKPDFQMFLGNEIFFSEGAISALEEGAALTMNGTRYVLVEFPVYADFSSISRGVRNLQYAGFIPILAHIERYEGTKKRGQVEELADIGAYMQVNASTVTGRMGWQKKRYVLDLIRHDLVHILGTDAHGSEHRRPEIRECVKYLNKKVGSDRVDWMCNTNPMRIIRGEDISE